MRQSSPNESDESLVGRLLARLDRVRGLGGGRTHAVFLVVFFLACLSLYLTVLKVRGGGASSLSTWTEWDRTFPFTPAWVWVYLLPYAVGPLIAVALSRAAFVWYVQRAALVMLVSLIIFAVQPTHTVRPLLDKANEEKLHDDLTSRMYRQMVAVDEPPANAAPSLHVSLACLLAWALAYDRPRWALVAFGAALVVWLSTLFTAQHHIIDVASGVLLASLAALGPPRRLAPLSPEAGERGRGRG